MSFFKNLVSSFGSQPLLLKMLPVDGGIKMGIFRGGQLLSPSAVANPKLMKQLPEPLAQLLSNNPPQKEGAYLLPYPVAKKLISILHPYLSELFQWDVMSVTQLQEVHCPANFSIYWQYDARDQSLVRNLTNAQAYLGTGWFRQNNYVWKFGDSSTELLFPWLNLERIPSAHIFQFVDDSLPKYSALPLKCDLIILSDFTITLKIIKMLKHTLEIQAVASHPALLADLTPLEGDKRNLLSGHTLLPNLAGLLTPRITQMLKSGKALALTKDAIPQFIQDEIRPHLDKLNIDLKTLEEAYPVVAATKLKPDWKLVHEIHQGIGWHKAIPYLVWKDESFTFDQIIKIAEKRFYAVEDGWLEFNIQFTEELVRRIKQGFAEFSLHHREILGVASERLKAAGLKIREFKVPQGFTEQESAYLSLEAMRSFGLPAAILGLQQDISRILATVCSNIYREHPKAAVLWIVSQSKKPAVIENLRAVGVNGTIVVATPNEITPKIAGWEWSLIILHDADVIASTPNHARLYSQLKRRWAIATLAKTNWDQLPQRVASVLATLQLYAQDYPLFRTKCLQTYSEQSEGLLSRLGSPFRKIFTAGTGKDAHSVPIPPRKTSVPPAKQPIDTRGVFRPNLHVAVQSTSPGEDFVTQAKRYVDRSEGKAEPVPFMHYYPTYEDMTPSQQRWYFYWRSQLRQGEVLPTDTSYLFIHIYEAINLIGFDSPRPAFEHLITIWKNYRVLQPKLERYLVDWIADFSAVHRLSISPIQWYCQAIQMGGANGDVDLMVEAWLQNGADLEQLPFSLLYKLAGYSLSKSKFYQQHNENEQIDKGYRKGLQAVNAACLEVRSQSLFELLRSQESRLIKRIPFANALHNFGGQEIEIGRVHAWVNNDTLANQLSMILKYTENQLRQQFKFKSKLRGIDIDSLWAKAIDKVFAPTSIKREVVLDLERIKDLQRETQEVRQRLMSEEMLDEVVAVIPAEATTNQVQEVVSSVEVPVGLLTELSEVAAVVGFGENINRQILRVLYEHNWQIPADTLQASLTEGQFLNVALDNLNEVATDHLGCSLIVEEDSLWIVEEDYRDEVEYLLTQSDVDAPSQLPIASTAITPVYAELTEEWAVFAQQMQPHHWEALNALLLNVDVSSRLDAIARSVYITANQIIDDINNFALDSIGDIVIDTMTDLPQIEEEDIEGLTALLEWARSNTILEI